VLIGLAQDPEKMKAMIAFKKRLEDQLEKLNTEAKEIQATLDAVNGILLTTGFKRGDIKDAPAPAPSMKEVVLPKSAAEPTKPQTQATPAPPAAPAAQPVEQETVIPLKAQNEEPLALMYFEKQQIHVMPDESKKFSINTPPFSNFLVEKVFAKMQEKDKELVRLGQLTTDKMFSYNIVREGELIREIIIKNVDEERLKELKSSIRWTLEKMYEKMKSA
jgi:ribosomal protein L11